MDVGGAAGSAVLGHGEQHGGVFERFEGVPGSGHDEQMGASQLAVAIASGRREPGEQGGRAYHGGTRRGGTRRGGAGR